MSNNYYDATGVLVLDKVTPIISALFSVYRLDEAYPGDGEFYIARISEESDTSWDEIAHKLEDLAADMSIGLSARDTENTGAILRRLSAHFGATDDAALCRLIETDDFDGDAGLDALFMIASCFDDGHGLQAIKWEGAWHCSRPVLFEFGGDGLYLSGPVVVHGDSRQVLTLGENLHAALLEGDSHRAAEHLEGEVSRWLAGIRDPAIRDVVRRELAGLLSR